MRGKKKKGETLRCLGWGWMHGFETGTSCKMLYKDIHLHTCLGINVATMDHTEPCLPWVTNVQLQGPSGALQLYVS